MTLLLLMTTHELLSMSLCPGLRARERNFRVAVPGNRCGGSKLPAAPINDSEFYLFELSSNVQPPTYCKYSYSVCAASQGTSFHVRVCTT